MNAPLDQIRAHAGSFQLYPLTAAVFSDSITPIELMRTLRAENKACYLLESACQDQKWGRWSFLGYDPELEITAANHEIFLRQSTQSRAEKAAVCQNPFEYIRSLLARYKSPKLEDMPPFTGGLVGFFAYDCIKYAEPSLKLDSPENADVKDIDLMLFKDVFVFDHYKQQLILITNISLQGNLEENYQNGLKRLEKMKALVKTPKKSAIASLELQDGLAMRFDKNRFTAMVEKAKKHIFEGDIFQAVLSNPLTAKAQGSLFDTYRVLRASNPSPYMFYFSGDNLEIAGASPETLVRLENGKLATFPLAGTRKRGANAEEDKKLEEELLHDEKELAEHTMLVDLGRNDLGKISRLGSVSVENFLSVQRFSHVMHIGSTVVGEIAEDKDALDAIAAVLPAGTLSGAPKIRACEIIQELEQYKRGIYGGAIGYIDFSGNMDTCIAIRLAYKKGDTLCVQSGAGIVYDSNPESEFLECQNKAKAVMLAIQRAKELADDTSDR